MNNDLPKQIGDVNYNLRVSKRARRMRISVACDAAVVVTVPWGFRESLAEKFVHEKLSWIKRCVEYFKLHPQPVKTRSGKREYKKHRQAALLLAQAKVNYWNQFYNFSFKRISIRNSKTRWGSCSKKGNLNFNYKIVHLPEKLVDYLVVHELCHLKEFNHSGNFWSLVGQTMPEYKNLRRELSGFRMD